MLARGGVPVAHVEVVVALGQLCERVVNGERGGSVQIASPIINSNRQLLTLLRSRMISSGASREPLRRQTYL